MTFVISALLAALLAPAAPKTAAEFLARRIEERQEATPDLVARFTQTYRSGALGRTLVERGEVKVKRPGRMLWEYKTPEKKTFVSDGQKFYFYVPADKQVIVRDQDTARGLPALLLSGKGAVLGEFVASLETGPPGRSRLKLVPRAPDPEIARVFLEADAVLPHPTDRGRRRPGQPERFRLRRHPREPRAYGPHLPVRDPAGRRSDRGMRAALAVLALGALAGCATSSAFRTGEQAERRQDWDRAVLEYSRALKENPDAVDAARGLAPRPPARRGATRERGPPPGRTRPLQGGPGRASAGHEPEPDRGAWPRRSPTWTPDNAPGSRRPPSSR